MKSSIRVLHLEDKPRDTELVRARLTADGLVCDFIVARDRASFESAVLAEAFDLILVDYQLPGYDGMAALLFVRAHQSETPVIIVSGSLGDEQAVECLKQGATDFVLKQRLTRLVPSMRRALHESEEHRQLAVAEKSIRASEARYRELVSGLPVAAYTTDVDGTITLYNEAAVTLWGRRPEVGEKWCGAFKLFTLDGKPMSHETCPMAQAIFEDRPIQGVEAVGAKPDGRQFGFLAYVTPFRESSDVPAGAMNVMVDITERKSLEEQFRQAQKMETIGLLAGGVAHDFNNMLTAIQGHVSLLTMTPTMPERTRESLDEIMKAARRATNLTRQLLLFARREVMQPTRLNLNETVTQIAKMLQRLIGENVSMKLHLHSRPLVIHGDAGMIDQVLMNLAVNARDAMLGGGDIVIETSDLVVGAGMTNVIEGAEPGRYACLSVSDTGTGISPEILPRIFEPFFTTKEPGKGTGLGLATVFGIVKQHRGWVSADSKLGHGTTFRVFLPLTDLPANAVQSTEPLAPPTGRGETVILVEDDEVVRELAFAMLDRNGYKVITARNGKDALRMWPDVELNVDLLLTDMVMPGGISGNELAARLLSRKPDLKVVFTSGYSAEIAGRVPTLPPGQAFLQKPFELSHVLEVIHQLLHVPAGAQILRPSLDPDRIVT